MRPARRRGTLLAARLLCGIAFALLTCSACTESANVAPEGGRRSWTVPGTLRIAIRGAPDSLDPMLTSDTTDKMLNRLTFDPLVSVDAGGTREVPVLAAVVPTRTNGGIAPDGLTITYKLRRGVQWQDGAPFTSKDVKFSWQAIVNPANDVSSRAGYDLVRSVDTPDAHTAVFHLKEPFSPAVDTLFGESDTPMFIVPEHLLGRLPNLNQTPFNAHPVGTGPFRVKRWLRGDRIEYVANERYFLGRPKLRAIVVRIVPSESTEASQLRAHEIDWFFEPTPHMVPVLAGIRDVTLSLQARNQEQEVVMNLRSPVLRERAVRLAIAHALDKRAMTEKLTFGTAAVADDEHPRFMWAHIGGFAYPYDPAEARRLLARAGWRAGSDGTLRKAGRPLALTLAYVGADATSRATVVLVQSYLQAVGIAVTPKGYPLTLFAAPLSLGGIQASGTFDLAVIGWAAGIDPDDSVRYLCRSIPPGGDNYARYCSTAMDSAQRVALARYDRAQRRRAYRHIQQLVYDDLPDLFLWWPRQLQATSVDFKGFAPNPVNEAWNAWQWQI